jgi:hypothetical protein
MSQLQSRRTLLKCAGALFTLSQANVPRLVAAEAAGPIREVLLDLHHLHKWDDSRGDTWDPFWADDDNLYAFNCDGRGFGTEGRNLAFTRLSGGRVVELTGVVINTMDEYGVEGKKEADGATWKVCGQECIDGVFYAFVSRNTYGKDSGDYWLRQTAVNSSLIKSHDRGRTWSRSAAENYAHPMWEGGAFGTPFFVHYGKNGGRVTKDGADRYVYAVSNNGFWNDGDYYILGRVPRPKLSELNAADWTYFAGGERWSANIRDAVPILSTPVRCGQTPPCFIEGLGVYLMVVWYNTDRMTTWFEPNEMRYDFFQAQHPWGPWTPINSFSDRFLSGNNHMYGPSVCAKFQEVSGREVKVYLFTSGCPFEDFPSGMYKAWCIPVLLKTAPLPKRTYLSCTDPKVKYTGAWRADGLVQMADAQGSSAEVSFNGTGIVWVADKAAEFGIADVFVDGKRVETVNLAVTNLPRLRGVEVFRTESLSKGDHTISIVSGSGGAITVDSFIVYGPAALNKS